MPLNDTISQKDDFYAVREHMCAVRVHTSLIREKSLSTTAVGCNT